MKQMNKPWVMGSIAAAVMALIVGCGGGSDGPAPNEPVVLTPASLSMARIGGYVHENPTGQSGAAEVPAYDPLSRRLFVVNAILGSVDVLDLNNPSAPVLVQTLDVSDLGASVNSVAIHNGVVALAIEADPKTDPGLVAFYRAADLQRIGQVTVGALPDMLVFRLLQQVQRGEQGGRTAARSRLGAVCEGSETAPLPRRCGIALVVRVRV